MPRKKRSDSISAQVEMTERLKTTITSPIPLSVDETKVFDSIIGALPLDSWDDYRVRLAASLAKLIIHQETLMTELAEEGVVIMNQRGTPITNPKQTALMQSTNTMQSMTRTLGLSASQRGVSDTSTKAGKQAEKKVKEALDKAAGSDGLLA